MWNAHQIRTEPFMWEEITTESRKLNAWNVHRKIFSVFVRKRMRNDESSSSSDDNSNDDETLKWSSVDVETKKPCEVRAKRLNKREVLVEIDDMFEALHIVPETDECDEEALDRTMLRLTSSEIKRSMTMFHNIIVKGRRSRVCSRNTSESNKCYYWGKECIRTGTKFTMHFTYHHFLFNVCLVLISID